METDYSKVDLFCAEHTPEELHDILDEKSWRDPASRLRERITHNRAVKWVATLAAPVALMGFGLYTLASADSEVEPNSPVTDEITTTTNLSTEAQQCIDAAVRTFQLSPDHDVTRLLAEREACVQNELLSGGFRD